MRSCSDSNVYWNLLGFLQYLCRYFKKPNKFQYTLESEQLISWNIIIQLELV